MLRYPGCAGWHGASSSVWLDRAERSFRRGSSGVFSFYGGYHIPWNGSDSMGRGVAVVGTGLLYNISEGKVLRNFSRITILLKKRNSFLHW